MIPTLDTTPLGPARNQQFTATHWSVVLAAREPDCPAAQEALERLCQTYWYPLYAYARRKGCPEEDAKDATQALFAGILEKQSLAQVRPEKGKFRSFLVACLNHLLSDRRDRVDAQKRGGGRTILSLDDSTVEDRYRREPADLMDPEKLCERRWALTVLEQAQLRLQGEFVKKGKSREYEMLKDCLSGDEKLPRYAEIAADLQCAEDTVKSKVKRMRGRLFELLRQEVASTVSSPDEVDEELRSMRSIFGR